MRIGIDPGLQGALALLDGDECLEVIDMPVMLLGKNRHQVNAAELAKILAGWKERARLAPLCTFLERVAAMPGQGVASMFNFGVTYGAVQGILGALQIPMVLVSPQLWKKRAGLLGKNKDAARTLAQQLYPTVDLAHKKDVGRADAILIARFGLAEREK